MKILITQTDTLAQISVQVQGVAPQPIPGVSARAVVTVVAGVLTIPAGMSELIVQTAILVTAIQTPAMAMLASPVVDTGADVMIMLAAGGSIAGPGIDGTAEVLAGPRWVRVKEYNNRWVIV